MTERNVHGGKTAGHLRSRSCVGDGAGGQRRGQRCVTPPRRSVAGTETVQRPQLSDNYYDYCADDNYNAGNDDNDCSDNYHDCSDDNHDELHDESG